MNNNIIKIAGIVFAAFALVIVYLTYIQVVQGDELLNHPRNRRLQILEGNIARGRIIDSADRVLAETVTENDVKKRLYPYGEMTAHITGYNSRKYGRWGLEATYNEGLLGLDSGFSQNDFWALKQLKPGSSGNDLILSVDAVLQEKAYRMLGDRKGAVVAIEPATGRVLAMVSKPGFNPENISEDWEKLREHPDSPLLNRAAQGLYPPGSTMKVITAAGILTKSPEVIKRIFEAPGYVVIEGHRIEDAQAVGRLDLSTAMALSSNFVFTILGLEQGAEYFVETVRNFGIIQEIPFDLFMEKGRIPGPDSLSKLELAESAIGQGRVLVTPLRMAMVAAAVANKGTLMAPSLVDRLRVPDQGDIWRLTPKTLGNPISENVAALLSDLMVSAVDRGTGKPAAIRGIRVAGKTGSAENPHGNPHAWFIGFAPADNPLVAVAVIVENGGAGGTQAGPIAREIMKTVIGQMR